MMTGNFLCHNKRLILSLLILGFSSTMVLSQKSLSGNLNQPAAHVISIPASDRITVDDATNFAINDTILLMQMQGVEILTGALDYGNINGFLGQPGMHEFMIIQSVNYLTQEIVFRNNLLKTYDTRGNIQIVRVAYYNSVVVTGTLTCNPWNSTTKTGGVLALIVGRSLKLNADIDVSSKGFIGGNDIAGEGRCQLAAPLTSNKTYPLSFLNAGFKGEGIAIHDFSGILLTPNNVKGNGPNFTGGGGGNGRFAGGGGGSNRGAGGTGGYESNACTAPQAGGLGGIKSESPSFPSLVDRIYLGGGGGASTSLTGLSQPGGNGGGIVIIVTDTIIGNSHKIISNGSNGGTAVANGGSGGGGAGGSVALSVTSYGSTPLTISVSGGNGGDNPDIFGEGGGGGGGLFYYLTPPSANVQIFKDGGTQGNFSNPPVNPGFPGDPGDTKPGFKAILNGFLFNSIRSSVTGNQTDSICSNIKPPKITGTIPVGGTPSYTYLWEKSIDQVTWTLLPNDPDPVNFTPAAPEPVTVWYRRTITDQSSPTPLVDVSKPVKIIVQPAITANNIGKDTTICQGQNPLPIGSVPLNSTPSNGNGIYRYKWLQNLSNSSWDTLQVAAGSIINNKGYDPPSLTQTTYYKRFVQSGRCIDFSPSVKITVLNSITGNIITRSDSVICQSFTFVNLGATAPGQGQTGNYLYQWQDSITSSVWNPAIGSNTGTTYLPDTSTFSVAVQNRFYRRIVFSGPDSVCKSKSLPIRLTRYPKIINNLINANLSDLTICSGNTPLALPGTNPVNGAGAGSYSFIWQQSANGISFNAADGINNSITGNYQPPVLTDTTWYRRIVNSGVYKTAVVCTNTSPSIRINVHKPILNNDITVPGGGVTETKCYNQQPGSILGTVATGGTGIPGSYIYQWKFSPDNSIFTDVSTGGTGINYQPPQLIATTYYKREVTSGACIVTSNPVTETILPLITNNTISGNAKVCYSLIPDVITGATLSGGSGVYKYFWSQSMDGGANWVAAAGTNNSSTYQPPALFTAVKYERTVTSGLNDCCTSTSNIFDIGIDPLPVSPIFAGPDTTIYSIEKMYHMKAIDPGLVGETGTWAPLNNGTSSIEDTTSYKTIVRNLSSGKNSFLWTVHKGPCKLTDSVNIELLQNFVPQGFSPNGDAWNNTFVIEGLNLDDNYVDLSIVNGAGTEVFKTSNRDNQKWTDWDGKNSKGIDLPEGTYYYLLKVTSNNSKGTIGQVYKKSGFIVLKRY
jgi:gliding motility-associated-like protein